MRHVNTRTLCCPIRCTASRVRTLGIRFAWEGLPISCSQGNCWQSTSLYKYSSALNAWRCVEAATRRSLASMVKKSFNFRSSHDEPTHPEQIRLRGPQAVVHIAQALTHLVQQARCLQRRMRWAGGLGGFYNTVHKNSIIKFASQIKRLPKIYQSCSSARDVVHKQLCRVWSYFYG